ncbi:TetR/AcrR family transcriptional regulator [Mycolicibacterium moriokaense]|nr:TetR/AcrR family transcriptional regulator [Mycolicibacterium moriokaense]
MTNADHPGPQAFTTKGRATRERILRSAAEVLLSEGLTGFNLEKVRSAASVSGSQLSHYFADKPALVRGILNRQTELVLDFHRQPRLGALDTFDDFERWADLTVRFLRTVGYTNTPIYHTLAGQLVKSDSATRQTLADGYWRWVELLGQRFERMTERGVLVASADPRRLALTFVGGHQGAGIVSFAYRDDGPLAHTARFLVNHLRSFAAEPAERVARKPPRPRQRRVVAGDREASHPAPRFTQKGMAMRRRIITRTADLMFEQGVHRTSLVDVREAVGVSDSQLSHYFTGKRDLVRQVVASRANDVIAFHRRPALGRLDSLAALRAWVEECVADIQTVYLRGGCVYGSLAGELLEADEGILDDVAAGYEQWIQLFHDGLSDMKGRGELSAEADPRHLATALVTAHQGGALLAHATGSAEPFEVLVSSAVDYVAAFRPRWRRRRSRSRARPSHER